MISALQVHRLVPDGTSTSNNLGPLNGRPYFFLKKLQNVMVVTEIPSCFWQLCNARTRIRFSGRMAMNNKLMLVAFGYLMLLAALGFVLDASIAATIV
jgi:hypothetical protein